MGGEGTGRPGCEQGWGEGGFWKSFGARGAQGTVYLGLRGGLGTSPTHAAFLSAPVSRGPGPRKACMARHPESQGGGWAHPCVPGRRGPCRERPLVARRLGRGHVTSPHTPPMAHREGEGFLPALPHTGQHTQGLEAAQPRQEVSVQSILSHIYIYIYFFLTLSAHFCHAFKMSQRPK